MTLWSQNERTHQARVDAIVASARAQSAAPASAPRALYREIPCSTLPRTGNLIEKHLEEELAFVRRTLDAVGDRLCEDPILLMRYETLLQSFDMLGQTLGHIGSVIGAANKQEAIDRIGMVELRRRLQRGKMRIDETAPMHDRGVTEPFKRR